MLDKNYVKNFHKNLAKIQAKKSKAKRINKALALKQKGITKDDKRKALAEQRVQDYVNEYYTYHDVPKKTLRRIRECDDFAQFLTTKNKGHKVLEKAMFCGGRFCPICQHRRSVNIYMKLSTIMKAIERHALKRGHKVDFIFGTFTVPNTSSDPKDVKDTVSLLHKSFAKMMKYRRYNGWSFQKGTKKRKKGILLGAFTKIESTTNYARVKPFHIHLHALMVVRSSYFKSKYYVKQDKWRKDWERATKLDRFLSVKIVHCYYKDHNGNKHTLNNTSTKNLPKIISKATEEIAKYPTKAPAEYDKAIANKKRKGKPKHSRVEIFHGQYAGLKNQNLYTYIGDFKYYSRKYENDELADLMPQNPYTFTQEDNETWNLKKKKYDKKTAPLTNEDIKFCKDHNLKFETKADKKIKASRNRIAINLTQANHPISKLYECTPKAIKKANQIVKNKIKNQKFQANIKSEQAKISNIKSKKAYKNKMKSRYNNLIGLIGNAPL